MYNNKGFTLIELMVVTVIVAILVAVALPSYQIFIQRADIKNSQQEILKIAEQLERYKSRSFSYYGFDPTYLYGDNVKTGSTGLSEISFPSTTNKKYIITIADISGNSVVTLLPNDDETLNLSLGKQWSIRAEPVSVLVEKNYPTLLLTQAGIKCMNKNKNAVTYLNCGNSGNEAW